ncbi:INO80 complex subunit E isoform X8 [Dama dama]|uniref:INO80 complex subunit E isoform X8 n=1 Tax=Dama dama TaxID=30532 RepID=UPI002A3654B6|nr:INO80 complex subunit E isoform X8 [Dama dama]
MNGPADGEVDYKKKYRNLKRKLKFLIYEHECFQEELRKAQRKLLKVSRDKSFLLDRLLQYENVDEDSSGEQDSDATASSDNSETEGTPKLSDTPAPKRVSPSGLEGPLPIPELDGGGTPRLPCGRAADLLRPGLWGWGGGSLGPPTPTQDAPPYDPECRSSADVQRRGQRGRRPGRG